MRWKRQSAGSLKLLLLVALLIPNWAWAAQTTASAKQLHDDADGYEDFSEAVLKYVKVHDAVEAHLQRINRADSPANIDLHQQELVKGIRDERSHARRGDIFT